MDTSIIGTPEARIAFAEALAELQTNLPRITKDQTAKVPTKAGGSYQYSYADLAQISDEILPMLGKLGLSFTGSPTLNAADKFVFAYELLHKGGASKPGEWPLPSPDRTPPQEVGSAITYARRYCLCAATGAAPDLGSDDDGAAASKAATRRAKRETTQSSDGSESPTRITAGQTKAMQDLFREMDVTDKTDKLNYAVEVVNRPLRSAADMTHDEAEAVIAKLRRWHAKENPPAEVPA